MLQLGQEIRLRVTRVLRVCNDETGIKKKTYITHILERLFKKKRSKGLYINLLRARTDIVYYWKKHY